MESPWCNQNLSELIKTDDNFMAKCPDIVKDILGSRLKFVHLVEKLGEVLTDKDPHIRFLGTNVLAEVLLHLPNDFLIESELIFILAFFVDRLADHYNVTPAVLKGIMSIVQMEHLPLDTAKRVTHAVFQHVQCQTLKPEDRRKVYKIFQHLMHNYKTDLQSLGPDFVYGLMSAVDQEKDARNLSIVFEMLPVFIRVFDLGHLKEEMFEIVSCYFPIDYRPDYSNCPVSREVLAEGLQNCLIASPDFSEFCLPLLVEKLDSKLKIAKIDSFKVLIKGSEIFTYEAIKANLLDLWRIIQHEILPGSDREIRELGLAFLKALVKRMSLVADEMQNPMILKSIVQFVINAGINSLGEVELNLFLPAVKMMLTVAEASTASCQEVNLKVLPVLIQQYYRENHKEQKVTVLRALTSFIAVSVSQNLFEHGCLLIVTPDISTLFLGAAQSDDPDVRKEGYHGLSVSAQILNNISRSTVYDLLKMNINKEEPLPVREEILICLKQFSMLYPHEVLKHIVEVKIRDIQSWTASGDQNMCLVLKSLCKIADEDPFSSLVIPCLLHLITGSSSLEKCKVGVTCFRELLESCYNPKIFIYVNNQYNVVTCLTNWWLQGIDGENSHLIFENEEILSNTAQILNIVVKNQQSNVQCDIVSTIMPQIIDTSFTSCNGSVSNDLNFESSNNSRIVIIEAILSSVHIDIKIPHLHGLVIYLVQLALKCSHSATELSASRLSANLINKAVDDQHLLALLSEIFSMCNYALKEDSDVKRVNAVKVMIWISKALVMRGHAEMKNWVENLIELMSEPHIGSVAAEGFSCILREVEFLNTSNFCNIRILYRQRFFSFTPKLIGAFHNAPKHVKANYLKALSHMLQGVPQEVLVMELDKMVPLLVESLQQMDEELLITTLETLLSVLKKSKHALQFHLQTFIPRILILTCFGSSMEVRLKAVQCIHQFCYYPTELILPFKSQVLKALGECLDDHKRLVRKEVVLSRSHWFLVGTKRKIEVS